MMSLKQLKYQLQAPRMNEFPIYFRHLYITVKTVKLNLLIKQTELHSLKSSLSNNPMKTVYDSDLDSGQNDS